MNPEHPLIAAYHLKRHLYDDFGVKLADLLDSLLRKKDIPVHAITHRCKEPESLARKLSRLDRSYSHLDEVTDLAAIRITTYYHDDVDRVAKIVEKEFSIDKVNSIDKRAALDPDRFGYLSLHYVVKLTSNRAKLGEYSSYSNLPAEIQIRSLLQHTWAEIEHDLGYKSKTSIPSQIRRRFSRLAGLLELADCEFAAIRDDLIAYEEEVPQRISAAPEFVLLDKVSLKVFIANSSEIGDLDSYIADLVGARLVEPNEYRYDWYLKSLNHLEINTIGALNDKVREHIAAIKPFSKAFISEGRKYSELSYGISLQYFAYVFLVKTGDLERIRTFIKIMSLESLGKPLEDRMVIAAKDVGLWPASN